MEKRPDGLVTGSDGRQLGDAGSGDREARPDTRLPRFPRGYCPVVRHCWEKAGYKFEIVDNKPVHWVSREAFEKSGIVVHRVAPVESLPEEAVETTTE
jgi:hypothetical protein